MPFKQKGTAPLRSIVEREMGTVPNRFKTLRGEADRRSTAVDNAYSAAEPVSPVRMRIVSARSYTKILPSQI